MRAQCSTSRAFQASPLDALDSGEENAAARLRPAPVDRHFLSAIGALPLTRLLHIPHPATQALKAGVRAGMATVQTLLATV